MLAKPGVPFDSSEHLFEIKWDGTRVLAFVESRGFRLINRHRVDDQAAHGAGGIAGKEIVAAPASEGPQVINLMEALKQSVARVQGTNSTRKESRKTTRRLLRKIS